MSSPKPGFSTRAIHEGYDAYAGEGSLTPPIYHSATYAFPSVEEGAARFAGEGNGYIYARLGTPSLHLLEQRMASLESAEAAIAVASGMGAITSLLWTLLRPGDELIADKTLYGCTYAFLNHGLSEFGVVVKHVDFQNLGELRAAISPKTKGLFYETPANPNMRILNIAEISKLAKEHGVWTAVDNTFLSPYLQRPIEHGADFVVHSATKYISGHGDVVAGFICGRAEDLRAVRYKGLKDMTGAMLGGFDAALLLRGIKTLKVRMDAHCASAMKVAEFLASHPKVDCVYYPGLPSDPNHALAKQQMDGFGGMLACELKGGLESGKKFLNSLQIFIRAVSFGDAESLAQHPASMTHSTYTAEERAEHGISDGLVRLSVGLEDVDDLISDLDQALGKA